MFLPLSHFLMFKRRSALSYSKGRLKLSFKTQRALIEFFSNSSSFILIIVLPASVIIILEIRNMIKKPGKQKQE